MSGLVTQPIKGNNMKNIPEPVLLTHSFIGARKSGLVGIFAGIGKGAVGLFMRPATGLLDLTSATLTVVQR